MTAAVAEPLDVVTDPTALPVEDIDQDQAAGGQTAAERHGQGDDPHAPWGRRKDGTPRGKPGRPRKTPPSRPTAPRKSASSSTGSRTKGPDYRAGVLALLSLPAMLLGLLARVTGRADLAADSAAISVRAPQLADAAQITAEQDPRFAAILDRAMHVGPYGALVAAAGMLLAQVAANHGMLPAAESLGIFEPDTLITMVAQQQQEQQAAA